MMTRIKEQESVYFTIMASLGAKQQTLFVTTRIQKTPNKQWHVELFYPPWLIQIVNKKVIENSFELDLFLYKLFLNYHISLQK